VVVKLDAGEVGILRSEMTMVKSLLAASSIASP
jgi:hypothetical protein